MDDLGDAVNKAERERKLLTEQDTETAPVKSFRIKYKEFVQSHRKTAFLKNLTLSVFAYIAGGWIGAKLMKYTTDSKTAISTGSLVSQYIAGFSVFLPFQALDNSDIYHEEGKKYKYKELAKDTAKLMLGLGVLEAAYIVVRPILHYNFMKKGITPETASLYADFICIPPYLALTIPVGKLTGFIKKNKEKQNI